ncbi:transposase [Streptomyces fagopyri]|uniref:transposase n=1 Tax=Streptomyces fagopyri TaxID=2662397 RepID=UPI00368E3B36
MGSKSNRSRRYTEEFKRDAVALVRSSGKTVTEVYVVAVEAISPSPTPFRILPAISPGRSHGSHDEWRTDRGVGMAPWES